MVCARRSFNVAQGGFAKCYEMIDTKTNKAYAGKIISKSRLTKPHQRDKVCRSVAVICVSNLIIYAELLVQTNLLYKIESP